MEHELVIRGGTVVDGTGAPGRRADVGIDAGVVTTIDEGLRGARELDAGDAIVAPGFIDIHTHYDAQVFWDPALTPSCHHGVTTVVAGNCGFSLAPTRPAQRELIARTLEYVEDMDFETLVGGIPWDFETFPEYLASVERHGTVINFAAFVGHTALRLYVMGDEAYQRAATDDEVLQLQAALRSSLAAGAAGFATTFSVVHLGIDGLPVPSRQAERSEFEAMLDVMAEHRQGAVAVSLGPQCWHADTYAYQRRAQVPITYVALLTQDGGQHWKAVEEHERGLATGADVWPQVSPRPLGFQMRMDNPFSLNTNEHFGALIATDDAQRLRSYADPAWRAEVARSLAEAPKTATGVPRWHTYFVDDSPTRPELNGRSVEAIATELGCSPLDLILDLAVADGLATRVRTVVANDHADDVDAMLRLEHATLGLGDGGAHNTLMCDSVQATDFLGRVRDRELMPIEAAVRRLTGTQAEIFGFTDRGILRPGVPADVAVFDPATVAPGPLRRVRDFPNDIERLTGDQPVGMQHVVVNGTPIRVDGSTVDLAGARPGQVVRPTPRA